MNDSVQNSSVSAEMKVVVERAVRPVRAARSRKRRMREELLDHLTTIHEQELERSADASAAWEQAKRRFGDPDVLTRELQESVPRWNYVAYTDYLLEHRADEPASRFVMRNLLFSVFWGTVSFLLVLPLLWLQGTWVEIGVLLHVSLVVGFFGGVTFPMTLLSETMGQILYGRRSKRPVRSMILCGLAALPVFPILGSAASSVSGNLSGLMLGCITAPAAPLCFFLLARQIKENILHASQWADVEIEA